MQHHALQQQSLTVLLTPSNTAPTVVSAGSAASLAAVVTTPFDVVKTKQQTAPAGKVSSIGACLVKVRPEMLPVSMHLQAVL